MSGLHECQLYVSARRSLRIYNALSLSLSSLTECVCLCGPKSCFFPTSLSPLFCVDLVVDKAAPAQISKNKKKREIALFLSLSRSLFHEKALFTPVRDAFSLPPRIFSLMSKAKKKKRKNPKPSRGTFSPNARTRACGKREKKRRPISNESNFFLLRGAFCLCFSRSREGEEETLRGGLREREGNGSLSLPAAYSHFKERDKKVTTNFSHPFAARAQKRDRATETEERKNAHLK